MKIAIVIPVMAPETAIDWEYVQFCLNRTLISVLACRSAELVIIVVCQTQPIFDSNDPRIVFVKADFSAPDRTSIAAKRNDKGLKSQLGICAAAEFAPSHAMLLDADDLVSCRMFEEIAKRPHANAVCLRRGYEWFEGDSFMTIRPNFHLYCGSTFVAEYNKEMWPYWIGGQKTGRRVCDQSHSEIERSLLELGFTVDYIDEPRLIYVSAGADQLRLRSFGLKRKIKDFLLQHSRRSLITPELRNEFSIDYQSEH